MGENSLLLSLSNSWKKLSAIPGGNDEEKLTQRTAENSWMISSRASQTCSQLQPLPWRCGKTEFQEFQAFCRHRRGINVQVEIFFFFCCLEVWHLSIGAAVSKSHDFHNSQTFSANEVISMAGRCLFPENIPG